MPSYVDQVVWKVAEVLGKTVQSIVRKRNGIGMNVLLW
jgi:uncharacterized tellurite resistance protein B-like protein